MTQRELDERERKERRYQEHLERLRGFRLMDDDFMSKCFEGNTECIRLVLRIILEKPDLEVTECSTQVFVENLLNRSVRLDVLATDSEGRKFNIEIQRTDKGAGRKRARYNSSMMDANLLKKGEDFDQLPETYVIFITENDIIGDGQPVYWVERYISGSGKKFGDGTHILYVNGAYRDDSPIGRLMHDFSCPNPGDMYYDVLSERTKFFKKSKEGNVIMCKAMEDFYNQTVNDTQRMERTATAKELFNEGGFSLEKISKISRLPLDEVKKLYEERTRNA